ncbi:MAG: GTP 3',8-cyclase MoaA [Cyclobacteriaceae bacterium]
MLTDRHQRVHDYLRISLTDSCNFRCTYCMPDEDIFCMPQKLLMQPEEIESIAKVFVKLGVNKIRLTGGEPLVRKGVVEIMEKLSPLPVKLTLTTNGVLADKYIPLFKKAGIRSLNVSLDTLQKDKFLVLTKRDQFDKVWENILQLVNEGFSVKVNVVAMKGVNDDEVVNFIKLTKDLPLHIRFIEFMPFSGNQWENSRVITARQLLASIEGKLDFIKLKDEKHATAKKFKVPAYTGTFAFITTMSEPFCGDCNRMRLTADGKMKNCLFGEDELDILGTLRAGGDIEPVIRKSLLMKHAVMGGQFADTYEKTDAGKIHNRSMIKIGG